MTLHAVRRAVLRIIGAPDYECYVTHMREQHPDQPVLSRDDFMRERLAARYERPGARCC